MPRTLSARVRHLLLVLFVGVSGAALLAAMQGRSDQAPALGAGEAEFVPNQVLVQFHLGSSEAEREEARGRVGGRHEEMVLAAADRRDGKGDLEVTMLPPGFSVNAAIARLNAHPAVEFAEPNWVYRHQAASNDPYFVNGWLWGMYGEATTPKNQYGSHAAKAWAAGHTGSAGVYVGIIDEGFMYEHEDLAANTWTNPYEPVDGLDNDGNGYVDDIHGWDFAGNDNTTFDGTTDDHGTHVAGTIGALGGNGKGVAGVNWRVTLISGKFLGRNGGTTANAVKALDYFTDLKLRHGLDIVATNNSWGGGGYSLALEQAIARGGDADILFVAAAGNGGRDGVGDNNDVVASYPSNDPCDCVIAVASITSSGARSSFSNYGASTVDLGAPGSGIYSTLPGKRGTSAYGAYSGTSMATPHVTGAVALYAAAHPGASAAEIKSAILSSVIPTPSLAGKVVSGGRLNVGGF